MGLEETMLKRVRPSEDETASIKDTAARLENVVRKYLNEKEMKDIEVRLVGSVAKGTFLSDPDLDVFMLFPESVSRKDLEIIGLKAGEEILHGKRMYSEHPYTTGTFDGLSVDLVPCYRISDTTKLMTAVDRTPFHAEYVIKSTTSELRDEIRLMKVFMQGVGVYGAEPNTRGFSGYLCELIVIHYGSFINAVKAASEWKEGVTVWFDTKGPPMIGPIVVYDPVDSKRNVASAVHIDTFATFVVACKSYLKEPSERFYFPKERIPLGENELRSMTESRGTKLVTVMFERPDVNTDNIYSQIWKTRYALTRKLDSYDFTVLRVVHDLSSTKLIIVFELERDALSKTFKHIGPPVWVKTSSIFLDKWKDNEYGGPFIDDGQWNVIAERRHGTAIEMLTEETAVSGIGRDIDPDTLTLLDDNDTFSSVDKILLTELLNPKQTWDE